jgi:hypothetical protein
VIRHGRCNRRFNRSPVGRCGRFVGSALELVDPFFHLLARLESHHKLFWDKDFLARAGIACLASRPPLNLKDAEVPQFDPLFLDKRLDDSIERFLDDLLRLQLRETNFLGNGLYDLFFGHDESPVRYPPQLANAEGPNCFRQMR